MGKILDSKANALRPPTEGDWSESPTKRQLSKFQLEQPTVRTPPKGIDVKVLNERLLNLRKHLAAGGYHDLLQVRPSQTK
jgi:hypothetical protein